MLIIKIVSFETPFVYQFPMKPPADLVPVIIPAKYLISKPKLVSNSSISTSCIPYYSVYRTGIVARK